MSDAKARECLARNLFSNTPWESLTSAEKAYWFGRADAINPPQPTGPVTSEEAVAAYAAGYARASGVFREHTEEALAQKRKAGMDAAMPLLARDHGLLTPAEVERRAREWWRRGGGGFSGLVTALTAPTATGKEGV